MLLFTNELDSLLKAQQNAMAEWRLLRYQQESGENWGNSATAAMITHDTARQLTITALAKLQKEILPHICTTV